MIDKKPFLHNRHLGTAYTAAFAQDTALKPTDFPISEVLPAICASLERCTRLVLEAPPGAGKTTQVPLALLHADWCAGQKILMLEPRRVAARSAATWMARQLGESVGQTVGYRIRFESRVSAATRLEVVTEGILTRMIQDDPLLEGVGAILFDEFHERHLAGDLGLALSLDVQASLREDLRLVVMSATLDGERLAAFLQAERISSQGRAFPVEVRYFPSRRNEALGMQVRRCIDEALAAHEGDILVFLPGLRELQEVAALLQGPNHGACSVVLLYGEMPVEQQSLALESAADGRRIVLATNIAESSVTLPGVRVVIDSGLAREPRFDPGSGFSRLQTVMISQASADQRAGRAGRVAAGCCFRLWDREQRLDAARNPEIHNVDLAALALELAAWGASDLRFPDPPPPGALASARELLQRLGALDAQGSISALGRRMLSLGTHPRLAAMLLAGHSGKEQSLACDLAALIEGRDPLSGYQGDDWYSRWQALSAWREGSKPSPNAANSPGRSLSRHALQALVQGAAQWRKRINIRDICNSASAHELGDVLTHAYPDRIARKHPSHPLRYQLSAGRMARLHEQSTLVGEPWLVVSELRHEQKDSLVLRASPLDEGRLHENFADRFVEENRVSWDPERKALVSRLESRFDQIVLSSKPGSKVDPQHAAQALTRAVQDYGLAVLPWNTELQQWRARVQCLQIWMPERGWPDFSDSALLASSAEWLLPAFIGKTRLDALSSGELGNALRSQLDWQQQQALEQLAPARMAVPSGLARAIHYAAGSTPVLAVKLQELFGLASTPRIADGRVPLTLHLLSPGGKPLQITSDLESFWHNTYPQVKKEMKGRYPKHPWPDDPWTAKATHRALPRGQGN